MHRRTGKANYPSPWPGQPGTAPAARRRPGAPRQLAARLHEAGDELLGARRWYYAKILRKRATFIGLDVVPYFYALSENYGEPEHDYLLQYEEGRMTWERQATSPPTIFPPCFGPGACDRGSSVQSPLLA